MLAVIILEIEACLHGAYEGYFGLHCLRAFGTTVYIGHILLEAYLCTQICLQGVRIDDLHWSYTIEVKNG